MVNGQWSMVNGELWVMGIVVSEVELMF
jgi:hypothetical protein